MWILIFLLAVTSFFFLRIFKKKPLPPTYNNKSKKCVLISGCDTGFGNLLSRKLDDLGYEVIAACYNANGEDAKKLEEETNNVHIIPMDVSNQESVKEGVKLASDICGERGLWGVVNNAGIIRGMSTDLTPFETFQEVMAVNYFGVVLLSKETLPLLKKRRGRVVNVASIAGRVGGPLMAAYASSKFAVEGFSDSLRRELTWWGIDVSIIEPGVMRTALTENRESIAAKFVASIPQEKKEEYGEAYFSSHKNKVQKAFLADPTQVIDKMVHALTSPSPHTHYVVGKDAQFIRVLTTFPGWVLDAYMRKFTKLPPPIRVQDSKYWAEY